MKFVNASESLNFFVYLGFHGMQHNTLPLDNCISYVEDFCQKCLHNSLIDLGNLLCIYISKHILKKFTI